MPSLLELRHASISRASFWNIYCFGARLLTGPLLVDTSLAVTEREFFIDNLLVRIHHIIHMFW